MTVPVKSYSILELEQIVSNQKITYLVESLLPARSVNILVGDSGLGKTPLLVQLGLCVAAGIPFLTLPTNSSPVLYVDYENSHEAIFNIIKDLCNFLSITLPSNFRWSPSPPDLNSLAVEIRSTRPSLIIVDALRGLDPNAEKDNSSAANRINYLQKLSNDCSCSFLLLHHLKKSSEEYPVEPLVSIKSLMAWFEQASGARALINQTDTRIGVDSGAKDEDLIMRWHLKTRGEIGTWRIQRVLDPESADPIGYSRVTGLQLLKLDADKSLYAKLPDTFRYKDLKLISSKGAKSLSRFLQEAFSAGLLTKTGKHKDTVYHKVTLT